MTKRTKRKTTVVHCKKEPYDVYIARPRGHGYGPWGNPYSPKRGTKAAKVDSVQEALDKYEAHLRSQPDIKEKLQTLVGKRLGCWCRPGPCHGDVLIKLIREFGLEEN